MTVVVNNPPAPPPPGAPPATPPAPPTAPAGAPAPQNPAGSPPPPAPPATPPAGAAGEGEPPTDADPAPKWLPMRLQQHERSIARQLGAESVDQIKQRLERARELEAQEEQRRQAAMTELDRERDRAAKAEQRAQQLEQQHAEAQTAARITEACATSGVRNLDYARFLVDSAKRQGDTRTEAELITHYLSSDAHRVALGVQAPPSATPTPVSTTAPPVGTPPPTNGSNGQPRDAMSMTKEEWAAERKRLGLHA